MFFWNEASNLLISLHWKIFAEKYAQILEYFEQFNKCSKYNEIKLITKNFFNIHESHNLVYFNFTSTAQINFNDNHKVQI